MTRSSSVFLGAAVACALLSPVARAADDVATLKSELDALKTDYAARVAALEDRISQLEAAAAAAQQPNAPAPEATAAPQGPGASSATAFNPAISLILAGTYADLSQDPATYRIAGFLPSGDEVGPGERSFSLGESELTLSANVDPYFMGNLTVAIAGDNEVSVEEAYFRTISLPSGFSVKGGRFFSGFGYLNEVHSHAWDFVDQPLVYQAFFGGQRAQDGLQLKWLAPTDLFVELGAEAGSGEAYPGTRRNANGFNGVTLFAHVGGDLGDTVSWRGGVSWVDLHAEDRTYDDEDASGNPVVNAFDGTSKTWIVDGLMKWNAPGDPRRRYVKLQGEYMHRVEDGTLAFDTTGAALAGDYRSSQSGWYVQGVYQFLPRWRAGVRYDSLDSGAPEIALVDSGELTPADFPLLLHADPRRTTVMVDWNLSEFSRLRAQYAWDDARDTSTDEQLFLQYIYSLGAHGAHKF